MAEKQLLIIAHVPSENTQSLLDSVVMGAKSILSDSISIAVRTPFKTAENEIFRSEGLILLTTENLGYMSGALKDFFDRIYYFAVPDFIDVHLGNFHWFVFNIADIFITTGIIGYILIELFKKNNISKNG